MNPYTTHIEIFFKRVLELRHISHHISSILGKSIKQFEKLNRIDFISSSALIISDWTGPSDNGWEINNHTGITRTTYKDSYSLEVQRMISQECCFAFAQSFEALEKLLKDLVYEKIKSNPEFCSNLKITDSILFKRSDVPGGDKLFQWFKKASNPYLIESSNKNNKNIKFKEFWTVISEVRHAITHSNSILKKAKLEKTSYHFDLFEYFFEYSEIDSEFIQIEIDYQTLSKLLKRISEFGFQFFKSISQKEKLDWKIIE